MSGVKNKRVGLSRYIVPHESSDWYMRRVIYIAIGAGFALGAGSWLFHEQLVGALGLYQVVEAPQLLANYSHFMLLFSVTIAALSALVYFMLFGIFLFHRVAGPVYHMKRHMEAITQGEPARPLKLRNGDQLQDVAEVYNQLLVKLGALESLPQENLETQAAEDAGSAQGQASE